MTIRFIVTLMVGSWVTVASFAQSDVPEDRPQLKTDGPLTREQLEQRRADIKRREAHTLFGLGILHRRRDRLLESIRLLEEAITLDPAAIAPRKILIPLYLTFSRDEDAERLGREIVERDPSDHDIWIFLAGRRKEAGDLDGAITALRHGTQSPRIAQEPERRIILRRELANLLERKEQFAEARRELLELATFVESNRDTLQHDTRLKNADLDELLASSYERAGRLAVRERSYHHALEAFRKSQSYFLKLSDPAEAAKANRLNWNLAEVFMAQEKWGDALTFLDRFLEYAPPQIEAYEDKIKILRAMERESDIVPALRAAVGKDRNFVGLQLLLARELASQPATRREAEQLYLGLSRQYTKTEIYRGLFRYYQSIGRIDEILNRLDEAVKISDRKDGDGPREERDEATERVQVMIEAIQGEPAILTALLRTAATELRGGRPRESDTSRLLGSLAIRSRQTETAEALLRQALIGAPPQSVLTIYSELLPLLWERHDYREIIRICREGMVRADANAAYFHYHLASAYASVGQFDDALRHADLGVKLSSDTARLRNRATRSRILSWAGKSNEALAEAESLLKDAKLPAEIREARLALSTVHMATRNYSKSEEQLRLLLELDPNDALANNNLGYELADQGRNLDEAERLIRKAIALDQAARKGNPSADPENAAYLDSLGWVLFRKGQFAEARTTLERASNLADGANDPTVWDHLGDVYSRLELLTKAREAWSNALRMYERDKYHPTYDSRAIEVRKKLQQIPTREPIAP